MFNLLYHFPLPRYLSRTPKMICERLVVFRVLQFGRLCRTDAPTFSSLHSPCNISPLLVSMSINPSGVYDSCDSWRSILCSTNYAKVIVVALSGSKYIFVVKTRKRLVRIPKAFSVTLRNLDKR